MIVVIMETVKKLKWQRAVHGVKISDKRNAQMVPAIIVKDEKKKKLEKCNRIS